MLLEPITELSPSNKAHNLLKEQRQKDSEGGKSDEDSGLGANDSIYGQDKGKRI